ncbi:MAG: HD domain-containing protein [Ruminococcaceae bacterium]|nr:HD domain-containing protein [Oscillospiraceae bacterium]MBR3595573.1 HD domain-containing protein [Clostridia bacterium]
MAVRTEGVFSSYGAFPANPSYDRLTKRLDPIYSKPNDCRDQFERDYTRILHCLAYRRLKHKTQVFFNIENDHICTRMEHVSHVESVSTTIAKELGLNVDLTRAIAIGHDLGHAPFGHQGERELDALSKKYLGKGFFHEKNGLHFVDNIELLEDDYRVYRNLNLTYAVRDGIISHCGEVDENGLRPREEYIDLKDFTSVGQYQPFTWEGCVVKLSDKIAYVGRDIEDAIRLRFLTKENMDTLSDMAKAYDKMAINTTVIIHNMIYDVCRNSSPEKGICLSDTFHEQLKEIKQFNYEFIYRNKRLDAFTKYARLVLEQIFLALLDAYDGENTVESLRKHAEIYPELMGAFADWISKFCDTRLNMFENVTEKTVKCMNKKIYGSLESEEVYMGAIIDYISGMSDNYAIKVFNELITY